MPSTVVSKSSSVVLGIDIGMAVIVLAGDRVSATFAEDKVQSLPDRVQLLNATKKIPVYTGILFVAFSSWNCLLGESV